MRKTNSQARIEIGYIEPEESDIFIRPNPEHRAGLDLRKAATEGFYICAREGCEHVMEATEEGCSCCHRCKSPVSFVEPVFYSQPRTTLAMLRAIL